MSQSKSDDPVALFDKILEIQILAYSREPHSKEGKVILLWWGYRFLFLLIFWVLHVHKIGPFMPNSSVFIFLMLRALYRMICKSSKKKKFAKKSLNVTNVKLLSNFFFNVFSFFMPFWWEWHLALYILRDFPSIRNLRPQWPQQP